MSSKKIKKAPRIIYLLIGLLLPLPINYISYIAHNYVKGRYNALSSFLPIIITLIMCFLIGIFLGVDHLINNIQSDGKWTVKWSRLIISFVFLVISLVISLPIILCLYYYRDTFYVWITIAGYLATTSFVKRPLTEDTYERHDSITQI